MDRIELENGSIIESIDNIGENTRSKRGQEQVDKIIKNNEIPKRRTGGSIEESARMEECIKSQMKKDKTMKSLECTRTDCEYFYENYCLADRKIFINEDGCKTFKEGTNILYKGKIDICNWCKHKPFYNCDVNSRDIEIAKGIGIIKCKEYEEL